MQMVLMTCEKFELLEINITTQIYQHANSTQNAAKCEPGSRGFCKEEDTH